jgi:hypothetical protein
MVKPYWGLALNWRKQTNPLDLTYSIQDTPAHSIVHDVIYFVTGSFRLQIGSELVMNALQSGCFAYL